MNDASQLRSIMRLGLYVEIRLKPLLDRDCWHVTVVPEGPTFKLTNLDDVFAKSSVFRIKRYFALMERKVVRCNLVHVDDNGYIECV